MTARHRAADRTLADAASEPDTGLHISIRGGTGSGPTTLAAFDAALVETGVADRNLIPLSSVIPAGATLDVVDGAGAREQAAGRWGDRLYVVLAECRVERPHEQAWAGIGWIREGSTGRGLFVEHHGHAKAQVEEDIEATLAAMATSRPEVRFGPPSWEVRGSTCTGRPVCSLVVAVYQSVPWTNDGTIDLR